MSWARFDDGWTDREDVAVLSYPARWHLVALIEFCCRTDRYDGEMRAVDVRRVSDVPDPAATAAELVDAGHLVTTDGGYRLVHIAEHIPPPHLRDKNRKAGQRSRKQRQRARSTNTETPAPSPAPTAPVTPNVTRDVTRDTGTGRDRTGQDGDQPASARTSRMAPTSRAVALSATTGTCSRCGRPAYDLRSGGLCVGCDHDTSTRRIA